MSNLWIPAFLLLFCTACEQEYLPGLEGSLVGHVLSFDIYGFLQDRHDAIGVTAFGVEESFHTRTTPEGRFEFRHLPAGTYEIRLEKKGYGTLKHYGVQHLGGRPTLLLQNASGNPGYFYLYEIHVPDIKKVSLEDNFFLHIALDLPEERHPNQIHFFLLASEQAGFLPGEATLYNELHPYYSEEDGEYVAAWDLRGRGVSAGSTLYLRMGFYTRVESWFQQGINFGQYESVDQYMDLETGELILPNLGPLTEEFQIIYE
ncbi:MAG: carboxypeptidase-like regulatory domain-containing protein [Bacteroidales bacterium]